MRIVCIGLLGLISSVFFSGPAFAQACNSGSSRPWNQAPINGNPIAVSATAVTVIEAEHFNCGSEGQGFHDTVTGVNAGQTFRADNEVELIAVAAGSLAMNQFDAGEWLAYSINVAATAIYDLAILASASPSGGGPGAYRIEVDGADVTGTVNVPLTGNWET